MSETLGYDVAVVGATGVVGEVMLELLAERKFPVNTLYPLASERSAGKKVMFNGHATRVGDLAEFDFSEVQLAFFSAGGEISKQYVPIAVEAGAVVIDNTSAFRYESDVPLVVPEVNANVLMEYRERNIIANPNCSTIQMVVALKPIYDAVGIRRVNVATYQSVSGAGRLAIKELARQTAELLNGQEVSLKAFSKQIAFNTIPQIDEIQDNGFTREEMKMIWETQKILCDENISINPTAVRVPVFYGHSEALHIETLQPITADQAREILMQAPGVVVVDDDDYPTSVSHAACQDAVFVGRIRNDISLPNGLNMWVVSDNVRKGAALNAIEIAEHLVENNFFLD